MPPTPETKYSGSTQNANCPWKKLKELRGPEEEGVTARQESRRLH